LNTKQQTFSTAMVLLLSQNDASRFLRGKSALQLRSTGTTVNDDKNLMPGFFAERLVRTELTAHGLYDSLVAFVFERPHRAEIDSRHSLASKVSDHFRTPTGNFKLLG
jgi:hypothetical protein